MSWWEAAGWTALGAFILATLIIMACGVGLVVFHAAVRLQGMLPASSPIAQLHGPREERSRGARR